MNLFQRNQRPALSTCGCHQQVAVLDHIRCLVGLRETQIHLSRTQLFPVSRRAVLAPVCGRDPAPPRAECMRNMRLLPTWDDQHLHLPVTVRGELRRRRLLKLSRLLPPIPRAVPPNQPPPMLEPNPGQQLIHRPNRFRGLRYLTLTRHLY